MPIHFGLTDKQRPLSNRSITEKINGMKEEKKNI